MVHSGLKQWKLEGRLGLTFVDVYGPDIRLGAYARDEITSGLVVYELSVYDHSAKFYQSFNKVIIDCPRSVQMFKRTKEIDLLES